MKQQEKGQAYLDTTIPRITRIQQIRKQRRDKIQQPALEFLKNLEKFNLQYYFQQSETKPNNIYYGLTTKQHNRYIVKQYEKEQNYIKERELIEKLEDAMGASYDDYLAPLLSFNHDEKKLYYEGGLCSLLEYSQELNKRKLYWFQRQSEVKFIIKSIIDILESIHKTGLINIYMIPQNILFFESNQEYIPTNNKIFLKYLDTSFTIQNAYENQQEKLTTEILIIGCSLKTLLLQSINLYENNRRQVFVYDDSKFDPIYKDDNTPDCVAEACEAIRRYYDADIADVVNLLIQKSKLDKIKQRVAQFTQVRPMEDNDKILRYVMESKVTSLEICEKLDMFRRGMEIVSANEKEKENVVDPEIYLQKAKFMSYEYNPVQFDQFNKQYEKSKEVIKIKNEKFYRYIQCLTQTQAKQEESNDLMKLEQQFGRESAEVLQAKHLLGKNLLNCEYFWRIEQIQKTIELLEKEKDKPENKKEIAKLKMLKGFFFEIDEQNKDKMKENLFSARDIFEKEEIKSIYYAFTISLLCILNYNDEKERNIKFIQTGLKRALRIFDSHSCYTDRLYQTVLGIFTRVSIDQNNFDDTVLASKYYMQWQPKQPINELNLLRTYFDECKDQAAVKAQKDEQKYKVEQLMINQRYKEALDLSSFSTKIFFESYIEMTSNAEVFLRFFEMKVKPEKLITDTILAKVKIPVITSEICKYLILVDKSDQAIVLLEELLANNKTINLEDQLIAILQLSQAYRKSSQMEKASEYIKKALFASDNLQYTYLVQQIEKDIGLCMSPLQVLEEKEKFYCSKPEQLVKVYINMAKELKKANKFYEAQNRLEQSVDTSKKIGGKLEKYAKEQLYQLLEEKMYEKKKQSDKYEQIYNGKQAHACILKLDQARFLLKMQKVQEAEGIIAAVATESEDIEIKQRAANSLTRIYEQKLIGQLIKNLGLHSQQQ